jgi:membrane-associated protease RseP (regulator of RpoE activity)
MSEMLMTAKPQPPKLAAVTLSALLVLVGATSVFAQASAPPRESGRVYRIQLRRAGDTDYVRTLRATRRQLEGRLDSLQHEFEELGLDAPDRVDLVRELRMILSSLSDLSQLEQRARRLGEPVRERPPEMPRAEPFAGMVRGPMAVLQPGWIGINAEAPHERIVRNDSAYIRYFVYPEVVSVEPNSPAERGGISRGDHLVAYDGADLRDHEINLTKLLQPSRRITVKVLRDGEERDFPIVVTRPPERWLGAPLALLDSMPRKTFMRTPMARGGGAGQVVLFGRMDSESAPLAGASLVEIRGEAFGHIFGVSSGVLVTQVFTDPARSSGLKGGDVILRADGQEVTAVAQLRRIVAAHNGDRVVELEIVRQKRTRTLTLRW